MESNNQTIFILDWSGTLDVFSQPAYFLEHLRRRFPSSLFILNSGYSSSSIDREVIAACDLVYTKRLETRILEDVIVDFEEDGMTCVVGDSLRRVVLVDDQAHAFGNEPELYLDAYLKRNELTNVEVLVFTDIWEFKRWMCDFPEIAEAKRPVQDADADR
jgi:hypothetical protein